MDEKHNYDYKSVFEGISKTRQDIQEELELLKKINEEQKIELEKAKRFNIMMLIIAIISLLVTIIIPFIIKS